MDKNMKFKLKLCSAYQDQNLVFTRLNGHPIYLRTLTTIFNRSIKKANVPKI